MSTPIPPPSPSNTGDRPARPAQQPDAPQSVDPPAPPPPPPPSPRPPRVTFVIPCYNHGRFVKDAVDSCLAQKNAHVHVVVVDDGSDDGSTPQACDACTHPSVTIIHQTNTGLPGARNRGAREAPAHGSDFLVFLDADDWVEPTFVQTLHAKLIETDANQADTDPAGTNPVAEQKTSHAYCQERLVELGTGVWRVPDWDPITLMVTNLHPVTALVRRDCFDAVGGFDQTMTDGYEDWDLWLKFAGQGWQGVRVRQPLFTWRRHSHQTMVMQVVHNHEVLYRRLMANHRALFDANKRDLLVRANTMLRRFDVNWIDETGEAIPLVALRKSEEDYERMVAVRLHHAAHRFVAAMPAPIARLLERAFAAIHRAGPAPRTMLPSDLPLDRLHTP